MAHRFGSLTLTLLLLVLAAPAQAQTPDEASVVAPTAAEAPRDDAAAPEDPASEATADGQDEPEAPTSDWSELDDALLEDEDWLQPDPADRDSIERVNRATHGFNEAFIRWVVNPVSRAYRFVVPDPARRGISRFFSNLNEPVILANDLLQFAPHDAGRTGARFLVNTTVGLVGFFDPASSIGLPGHENDFGQTLAVYGAPSGTYLVIPVIGPSSVRDAFGEVVDGLLSIDFWLLGTGPMLIFNTSSGMVTYDVQQERLDALRGTSVDFYAALRGAFLLDRDAQVEARLAEIPWRRCCRGNDADEEEPVFP